MNNYKDTFLWKLLLTEQPEIVGVLDTCTWSNVFPLKSGFSIHLDKYTQLAIEFDTYSGLSLRLSEYGMHRHASAQDLSDVIARINQVREHERKNKADISRITNLFREIGFNSETKYLRDLMLEFKYFISETNVEVEIGHNDTYTRFEGMFSVSSERSNVQTVQDCKDMCKLVLNKLYDAAKAETSQFE